jgi:CENP-S associating Centromere protein X
MQRDDSNESMDNPFHPSLVYQIIHSACTTTYDGAVIKASDRITDEALVAAGEVLRLFVQEAWYRAGIEAECEHEGNVDYNHHDEEDIKNYSSDVVDKSSNAPIRADHITKIAAELLMDFS